MPTARGRQASKKKAAPRRKRKPRAAVPAAPLEEVIRLVPLPDPDLVLEAPVAPEPPPPPRIVRAAGIIRNNPDNWSEIERNQVVNQLCLRLDRVTERSDEAADKSKWTFAATSVIGFAVFVCCAVLTQINRSEIDEQAKQLKRAEHRIQILLNTSVVKPPFFAPAIAVSSNGNAVTGTENIVIGYKATAEKPE